MTAQQLQHYLNGGKFNVIYNPTITDDLPQHIKKHIGQLMIAHQNMLTAPLVGKRQGQHAFNVEAFKEWVPEEDIQILDIIGEYITPEPLPKYMYRLTYSNHEQTFQNFGNQYKNIELPFVVGREYSSEQDEYVLRLSTPQADSVEKAIWNGEQFEDIKWTKIL